MVWRSDWNTISLKSLVIFWLLWVHVLFAQCDLCTRIHTVLLLRRRPILPRWWIIAWFRTHVQWTRYIHRLCNRTLSISNASVSARKVYLLFVHMSSMWDVLSVCIGNLFRYFHFCASAVFRTKLSFIYNLSTYGWIIYVVIVLIAFFLHWKALS